MYRFPKDFFFVKSYRPILCPDEVVSCNTEMIQYASLKNNFESYPLKQDLQCNNLSNEGDSSEIKVSNKC